MPSLKIVISESLTSTTVDGVLSPKPPSITKSTLELHFSNISSGSVVYSSNSSSSCIDVDTIGFPKLLTISKAIELSGMRIPTVFFFLKGWGSVLAPGKTKV